MRWMIWLAALCGGCGSLQYQGWSPSFRTFRDGPDFEDVYIGADAQFVVVDRPASGTPGVASARPLDAWNTPVASQPITVPDVSPVQEAGTSAEPVIDGK